VFKPLIFDRRHCHRNIDQAPVPAPTSGFIIVNAIIVPDTFENCVILTLPFRRRQDGHRFADSLLGKIAEKLLGALVPACDDAIEVLAYDCIVTELDDGSEPPDFTRLAQPNGRRS
jgi:hypothetical protein